MRKKHYILLGIILAIAVFFRFYLIGRMPGGLFPDEAANGLDINNIFEGHIEPFFGRGNGRESLFFYMLAASVKLFGRGYWQHHIVSALIGVISVWATYLFASRLFSRKVGLLSAFLMATGTWAIVISRTAFRANLIALFVPLSMYFAVCAIRNEDRKWKMIHAALFGLTFAAGFYTYIAFRIMVFILVAFVAILIIADRKQGFKWVKEYFKPALSALGGFLVGFAWLGHYFLTHPGSFIGRSGQVSVFNSDLNNGDLLGTLWIVFKDSLLAFFTQGDLNWRHNISGLPFLSPIVSPFFGIALLIATILAARFLFQSFKGTENHNHTKYLLMAGLFWGMLLPVVTTAEGIPHGLRSIGMMPVAYILAAVGIDYFTKLAMRIWHYRWMEKLYYVVAVMFCAALITTSYFQYFVYAYNSPENFEAFRSDLSVVSEYLNQNPSDKARTYLVVDLFSLQTVDYLTTETGNQYLVVDPASSPKLRLSQGDKVVFTNSTLYDAEQFKKTHPEAKLLHQSLNKFGSADMEIYQMTQSQNNKSLTANFDLSFYLLNFGDRIDFAWKNLSFDPWKIELYECGDSSCKNKSLLKSNNQNDYLSNYDWISLDSLKILNKTKPVDLYFQALAYDSQGNLIKDFGILQTKNQK
jgi:4-amino-4-deoxy-L-arabinose transferase-like glycosyltransferase